ncbi:MAG: alpha/beta hydrolase [Gemmatimonadaceae bacterium]
MQSHLALREISGTRNKGVQVLLAIKPNRKTVIFVHGFSGDAVETWSDFHILLPAKPISEGRDLFFFGYDGLRVGMIPSATIFRNFLTRLLDQTDQFLNTNLPESAKRPLGFRYDEVTIVAHSLGAVVARRALLDATRKSEPWVANIKLVLFAPAHKGAKLAELALEAASAFSFMRLFSAYAKYKSPLIAELLPTSPQLAALLIETTNACANGACDHLVAKMVIIAEYDDVVNPDTFANDPPPEIIPDSTHTSVCKPRKDFQLPLEFLERCL